jgi:hypothetical protein
MSEERMAKRRNFKQDAEASWFVGAKKENGAAYISRFDRQLGKSRDIKSLPLQGLAKKPHRRVSGFDTRASARAN